eukprot:jgi/Bigna1/144716/aug1.90_g19424
MSESSGGHNDEMEQQSSGRRIPKIPCRLSLKERHRSHTSSGKLTDSMSGLGSTDTTPPPPADWHAHSAASQGSNCSFYLDPPPALKTPSSELSPSERIRVKFHHKPTPSGGKHRRAKSSEAPQRRNIPSHRLEKNDQRNRLKLTKTSSASDLCNPLALDDKKIMKPKRRGHARNATADVGMLMRRFQRKPEHHHRRVKKVRSPSILFRPTSPAVEGEESKVGEGSKVGVAASMATKRREATTPELFSKHDMEHIVRKMRHEVGVSAQYHKFKKYKDSMSGVQIIDWVLESQVAMNEEKAIEFGTLITCWRFIWPVEGKKLNMSRKHMYHFVDEEKHTSRVREMLEEWGDFDKAKILAKSMFSSLPERTKVRKFKRVKEGVSGSAILDWLRDSDECSECQSDEDAVALGTLLLIHHLIYEANRKEDTFKMAADRFYQLKDDMAVVSMIDNPLLTTDSDASSINSLSTDRQRFWKKRYFRLKLRDRFFGSHLGYFQDDKEDTKQKGTIPLVQVSSVYKEGRLIKLKMSSGHKGKTSYTLRCRSENEAIKWVGALKPFVKATTVMDVLNQSAFRLILDDSQRQSLAKAMKVTKFHERTWISKLGRESKIFCLLHTGRIGVYMNKDEGGGQNQRLLTYQTPVSFFGEEMFDGGVCGASIRAETEVICAVLEKKKFFKLIKKQPVLKGQILNFLGKGVIEMLKKVSFLSNLDIQDLEVLRRGLHCSTYQAEQIVFYEGDIGERFYMILKGSVVIQRKDFSTGKELEVAKMDEGNYFGEVALIMDIGRTASVVVKEPSLILSINKKTFRSFLEMAGLDLMTVMRARIIEAFKKFKIPFFQAIPDEKFPFVAEKCRIEKYDKNETIFEEGDIGNEFYIISYGQVAISKEGRVLTRLDSGKYFGEAALVSEESKRTATCITCMETVLLTMSREDFKKVFDHNPEALADVELKLAGKNAGIRAVLHHPLALREFTKFLKSQIALESLLCWEAVVRFRKFYNYNMSEDGSQQVDGEKRKEVNKMARDILEKFVKVGSDQVDNQEVNIPDFMRKNVIHAVETGEIYEDVFFAMEVEIVGLMRNDKLSTFRTTPGFRKVLDTVGNYEDMDANIKKSIKILTRRSSMALRSAGRGSMNRSGTHVRKNTGMLGQMPKIAEISESISEDKSIEEKAAD